MKLQKLRKLQPKPAVPGWLLHFPGWLFSVLRWPSPETTEWFCQRAALWWVIQLAPALHLFAVSPSFSGMAAYGTEGHWQLLLGALLGAQTLAVLLGNLWMRVGTLLLFSSIWAFIAALFWASSPHFRLSAVPGLTHTAEIARNTGIGVYASLAVDCTVVAIHLVYRWYVDYLARLERDHPKLERDHPKLERDHPKLERDHPKLERDHPRVRPAKKTEQSRKGCA